MHNALFDEARSTGVRTVERHEVVVGAESRTVGVPAHRDEEARPAGTHFDHLDATVGKRQGAGQELRRRVAPELDVGDQHRPRAIYPVSVGPQVAVGAQELHRRDESAVDDAHQTGVFEPLRGFIAETPGAVPHPGGVHRPASPAGIDRPLQCAGLLEVLQGLSRHQRGDQVVEAEVSRCPQRRIAEAGADVRVIDGDRSVQAEGNRFAVKGSDGEFFDHLDVLALQIHRESRAARLGVIR